MAPAAGVLGSFLRQRQNRRGTYGGRRQAAANNTSSRHHQNNKNTSTSTSSTATTARRSQVEIVNGQPSMVTIPTNAKEDDPVSQLAVPPSLFFEDDEEEDKEEENHNDEEEEADLLSPNLRIPVTFATKPQDTSKPSNQDSTAVVIKKRTRTTSSQEEDTSQKLSSGKDTTNNNPFQKPSLNNPHHPMPPNDSSLEATEDVKNVAKPASSLVKRESMDRSGFSLTRSSPVPPPPQQENPSTGGEEKDGTTADNPTTMNVGHQHQNSFGKPDIEKGTVCQMPPPALPTTSRRTSGSDNNVEEQTKEESSPRDAHANTIDTTTIPSPDKTLESISRSVESSSTDSSQNFPNQQWACGACTYLNNSRSRRCTTCLARRPVEHVGSLPTRRRSKGSPSSSPSSKDVKASPNATTTNTTNSSAKRGSNTKKRSRSTSKKKVSPSKSGKRQKTPRVQTASNKDEIMEENEPDKAQIEPHEVVPTQFAKASSQTSPPQPLDCKTATSAESDRRFYHQECTAPAMSSGVSNVAAPRTKGISVARQPTFSEGKAVGQLTVNVNTHLQEDSPSVIASLRSENRFLRDRVQSLEADLARLQSSQIVTPVGPREIRQEVTDRLFEDLKQKTIESLSAMQRIFSSHNSSRSTSERRHRSSRERQDHSCRVTGTQYSPLFRDRLSVSDPRTARKQPARDSLPTRFSTESTCPTGQVEETEGADTQMKPPPAMVSQRKSDRSQQVSDSASKDPVDEDCLLASAEESPSNEAHDDASDAPNQTFALPSPTTNPSNPASPADSTQTMDPGHYGHLEQYECETSKDYGASEMEDEDHVLPKDQADEEERAFEPASPATSTQTTDPTASFRRRRELQDGRAIPGERLLEAPESAGENSSSFSSETPLSPAGSIQAIDYKQEAATNASYSEKTTVPSPHGQPSLPVDSDEEEVANSKMGPPPERRKEAPLGNSTNRKSSATWTSTTSNKLFLGQLERSGGSFGSSAHHGTSLLKTSSGWISKAKAPGRARPSATSEPGNLWDDSQEPRQGYKYHEVVRGKAKRQCLPGHDCPNCKAFYECVHRSGHEFSQNPMEHTRHRAQYAPPETPDEFWEVDFVDEKRGAGQNGSGA